MEDLETLKSLLHPKHTRFALRATTFSAGLVWEHKRLAISPSVRRIWANVERRDPILPPYFEPYIPPSAPYYHLNRSDLAHKGNMSRQKMDEERNKKRKWLSVTALINRLAMFQAPLLYKR
ncbi:unnamed protein product [Orchesella dallaii]|uniref:Uncharacterized protein n=1 Tax=Orchesella dallaii TaxID=48710 RepID=A0ABP1S2G1_9HEXA